MRSWILGLAAVAALAGASLLPVAHQAWRDPGIARWDYYGARGPMRRAEQPGASVGGRFYVIGGFHGKAPRATRRVDVYDPVADRWSRAADLPTPVTHTMAVVDGEDVWIVGGFVGDNPGVVTRESWILDTGADAWRAGPPLPAARASGGLARLGRRLHFFGGFVDRQDTSGDHWVLDLDLPNATWQPRAPLPEPRGHVSAAAVDGRVFAIGGQLGHDAWRRDLPYVHAYDPGTDRWRAVASLPEGRSHFEWATVVIDGRIVVIGGRSVWRRKWLPPRRSSRKLAIANVSMYDPQSDAWTELPALPYGLQGAAGGVVGDTLILAGGSPALAIFAQDSTFRLPLPLWD